MPDRTVGSPLWQPNFAAFQMILENSDVSWINYETPSSEQQQPPTISIMLLSQNTQKTKLWGNYAIFQTRKV